MINAGERVLIKTTKGTIIKGKLDVITEGTCHFYNYDTGGDEIIPLAQIEVITRDKGHPAIEKRLALSK